ncbi:poly(ADP-ribose) glycohydrolase isoform X2 [Parambassis ranga]|uniref:poly(ADP-ribose) glycohydrolase n=1 Tax=Parambassis ranga TaxID=210632 RepID=A0A6P7J9F1_9TELE|nr:poly(ADP-ribose) glycohydrolase-like isoform X2 [Parambassis ranga]
MLPLSSGRSFEMASKGDPKESRTAGEPGRDRSSSQTGSSQPPIPGPASSPEPCSSAGGSSGADPQGPEQKESRTAEKQEEPQQPPGRDRSSSSSQTTKHNQDNSADPQGPEQKQSTSSCCQLEDLKKRPQCNSTLGELTYSRRHFVLIDVDEFNSKTNKGRISPHKGTHQWSSHFVKMLGSQKVSRSGDMQERRAQVIMELSRLSSAESLEVEEVEDAIMRYNPKYRGQWKFDALSEFMKRVSKQEQDHYHTLLPKMAALALRLPEVVRKAVPLLRTGHTRAITLSQRQISCLLANAFFCTFPHRNTTSRNAEYANYPSINFSSLFGNWSQRKQEKLRAILHYFNVVTDENTTPEGLVTFERRCLKDPPAWRSCKELLQKLHVTSGGSIETNGTGLLQVDFACSMIGGGVLGSGLVQEEILFLINPELIVSRLFTEKLQDDECLLITGTQQFSCYSGYSDSFRWLSPHEDTLTRDEWARLNRQILAIDAVKFRDRKDQYNMSAITRELNKAYCGFKKQENEEHDVATGKWGCGAFNGDPQLKALIQLMAAAKADRGLAFFTFGDERLNQDLQKMHHLLVTERITVERLYGLLDSYCTEMKKKRPHVDLFQFIRNKISEQR